MDTQQGFLKGLFDTRFGTLITPKIIRVVYILTIIVLALIAIGVIIGAFNNSVGGFRGACGLRAARVPALSDCGSYLARTRDRGVQDQRVGSADSDLHRHDGGDRQRHRPRRSRRVSRDAPRHHGLAATGRAGPAERLLRQFSNR